MGYKNMIKYLRLAVMIASSVIVFGCVPKPKVPLCMYPADQGPEGYKRAAAAGVFDNGKLRISVTRLGKGESGAVLIEELIEKNYIVFRMELASTSSLKVMYNPSFTTLTNDEMDYLKPIDFTELYTLSDPVENGERKYDEPGAKLKALHGKLYDTSLTINPGKSVSRLLVFKPFSDGVKSAELVIGEIYVGTEAVSTGFPFVFKPKET